MRTAVILAIASVLLSACTIGSGTRTSRRLYQPTKSSDIEILFREPTRPFTVVGPVSSFGAPIAAENAMYRAVQKEAAELGANAIIIEAPGIGPNITDFVEARLCKDSQLGGAQSIRDVDPTLSLPHPRSPQPLIPTKSFPVTRPYILKDNAAKFWRALLPLAVATS
jgi:hypothetical protein